MSDVVERAHSYVAYNAAESGADVLIVELADEIARLRAHAKKLSDALLKVRPLGGSELFVRVGEDFYADPEFCGNAIVSLLSDRHEALKAQAHLRASEKALLEALGSFANPSNWYDRVGCLQWIGKRHAIEYAKSVLSATSF